MTGPLQHRGSVGGHWEDVYATRSPDEVSWYEPSPATSVRLVTAGGLPGSVIDVGAGASRLADELLHLGVPRVTALDLSVSALALVHHRVEENASRLTTVAADVLAWTPDAAYDVWHDRAVFHFLTDPADRSAYAEQVRRTAPGGRVVIATFAPDGPEMCSGLPTCRYDAAGVAEALGGDFGLLHGERVEHVTPWGTVQPFTWAVLEAPAH